MKKFVFAVTALLVATAMAAPVMAEDRVSLSGSMQVRGFGYDAEMKDNTGKVEDSGAWNDSRLRVGGKIAVADGVSVNFRMDAVESGENSSDATAWGFNPQSSVTSQYAQRRGDIQFDKAYLQFEKAGFTVAAGQNYFRQGMTGNMMDVVGAGFTVSKAGLKFQHVKVTDKNTGNDSLDKDATSGDYTDPTAVVQVPTQESSLTGIMYTIKAGEMTITPMATYRAVTGDGDRFALGVDLATNFGPVGFKAAVEYFTGESALVANQDEEGLNIYIDGSMKASDAVTVGAQILYAPGNTNADAQVTHMNDSWNAVDYTFADFSPFTYGYNTTDFVEEVTPFEIDDDAGMMALQVSADVKMTNDLKGKFAVAYAAAEEDKVADIEGIAVNASFAYTVAANTTLTMSANYLDATEDKSTTGTGVDEEMTALQGIAGLYVKF